ncbi:MAG: biotin carboxylase [Phycisphaerales bacterium]
MTTVTTKPIDLAKAKPLTSNIARRKRGTLHGISDIRRFFHRNTEPIYFISATNFNLVGIDEWVGNFAYINYIDCFDGQHPNVFVPPERPHEPFESIEDINNYLLRHPAVKSLIKKRGEDYQKSGGKGNGKAVFLMFDQTTEQLCKELGLKVCFPPASLRTAVDDKMETTRIGNKARVRSVPNKLARVKSYEHLSKICGKKLGDDLVIQTAYGDSGHTTFFVKNEKDFAKHEAEITSAPEVKIMKRIRCRGSALEACVTRHGTIVGPLMTELVGFPELTPYKGGWCGNEVFAGAFDRRIRKNARRAAMAFGDQLREMGYLGYFEIDFLTDLDTGTVYLGECNPRITGASSMTNLAAFAHADAPLFLFHLLEWMGVKYELDVDELNDRWSDPDNIDSWSQLVIKHTKDTVDRITQAPPSGIYELDGRGHMHYVRMQTHRRTVRFENRAFFLRIAAPGDYRYEGADLGILVSPGRFMDDDFQLTKRARQWIRGIHSFYAGQSDDHGGPESTGFKLL